MKGKTWNFDDAFNTFDSQSACSADKSRRFLSQN